MKHYLNKKIEKQSFVAEVGDSSSSYMQDITKEVGLALSEGQQSLDQMWIESQRERMKVSLANPGLYLPQASAFVMPEVKLDLSMQIKGTRDEEGNFKIVTTPHNAETNVKTKVNSSVSSKLALTFKLIPDEDITAGENDSVTPARQQSADLLAKTAELVKKNNEDTNNNNIDYSNLVILYIEGSRKWHVKAMDGPDPIALFLFDDTTGEFIDPIIFLSPGLRKVENVTLLGAPVIYSVNPLIASYGDTVTITGSNLGALNLEDSIVKVGGQIINPSEVTFERIQFKVDETLTSGYVSVTNISEGTNEFSERLIIKATPIKFADDAFYGYYDSYNKKGSAIRIEGRNFSGGTQLKFNGDNTKVSPTDHTETTAVFEVPPNAKTGSVSMFTENIEVLLPDQVFYLRPYIRNVDPKEASAGKLIRIEGNNFEDVNLVKIGNTVFELTFDQRQNGKIFAIKSAQALLLEIPRDAGDGRLYLSSLGKWFDSYVFFFQVPKIDKVPSYFVQGGAGEIYGTGFGKESQSIYVELQIPGKKQLVQAAYVAAGQVGQIGSQLTGFLIPLSVVTGKLRMIRTEILDEKNLEDTSALWKKKIPVFTKGTTHAEIYWCSPQWENYDQDWETQGYKLVRHELLECREENAFLRLKQITGKYFAFTAEAYHTSVLNLKIKNEDTNAVLDLYVEYHQLSITLTQPEEEDIQCIYEINNPLVKDDQYEYLFFSFASTRRYMQIQINSNNLQFNYDDSSDDNKKIIGLLSEFVNQDGDCKLEFSTSDKSFISSVIVTVNPSLQNTPFETYDWDFSVEELLKESLGIKLVELENFPTTEDRSLVITGENLTAYTRVLINEKPANTLFDEETNQLTLVIAENTESGSLLAYDLLDPSKRSNVIAFKRLGTANIDNVKLQKVNNLDALSITGDHFLDSGLPEVYIEKFGPLTILTVASQLIEVQKPNITLLNGTVNFRYPNGRTAKSKQTISISSLNVFDFMKTAEHATWIVPLQLNSSTERKVVFNASVPEKDMAVVYEKNNVELEDGKTYDKALIVCPPNPDYSFIEGRFDNFYIPKTAEIIFRVGFLREADHTDGIRFHAFMKYGKTKTEEIQPPKSIVYDGDIDECKIVFDDTKEREPGTLIIRVEPLSSSLDDYLAFVKAEMRFTHVQGGWTWIAGTNFPGRLNLSGIKRRTVESNMPSGRYLCATWQDLKGQIWIFGGHGSDENSRNAKLNDMWKYDGENWTWMQGSNVKSAFTTLGKQPGQEIIPGARFASAYWTDKKGVLWLFGGYGYHESYSQRTLNDLWKFEKEEWQLIGISDDWNVTGAHPGLYGEEGIIADGDGIKSRKRFWPLVRSHSAFYYDDVSELLWLFGGEYEQPKTKEVIKDTKLLSDLWTFDGTDWELISGTRNADEKENSGDISHPSARAGATLWTDRDGDLWLFGGRGFFGDEEILLNDLWRFDGIEWIKEEDADFSSSGNLSKPIPRMHSSSWKDEDGTLWLFGGQGLNVNNKNSESPYNDLWCFRNKEWEQIGGIKKEKDPGVQIATKVPYPQSWPASRYGASAWINPTGWFMLFGGYGVGKDEKDGTKDIGYLNDLWQFSPEKNSAE